MIRATFVASLAVLIVLSGCKVSTQPRTVLAAAPGEKLKVREARFNGEYRLFAAHGEPGKHPRPVGEPLATHRVRRGERLGFRRDGGELRAVAGAESIPIERGAYVWQMRADKGQIDRTKTIALVVFVAGGAALITQAVFASSFTPFSTVWP